jgi:hypothetical protein
MPFVTTLPNIGFVIGIHGLFDQKINKKEPILNSHQKVHPIILDTSFYTCLA